MVLGELPGNIAGEGEECFLGAGELILIDHRAVLVHLLDGHATPPLAR